jgi:hypothetical protein
MHSRFVTGVITLTALFASSTARAQEELVFASPASAGQSNGPSFSVVGFGGDTSQRGQGVRLVGQNRNLSRVIAMFNSVSAGGQTTPPGTLSTADITLWVYSMSDTGTVQTLMHATTANSIQIGACVASPQGSQWNAFGVEFLLPSIPADDTMFFAFSANNVVLGHPTVVNSGNGISNANPLMGFMVSPVSSPVRAQTANGWVGIATGGTSGGAHLAMSVYAVVPAPGTAALGVAGLLLANRRRR